MSKSYLFPFYGADLPPIELSGQLLFLHYSDIPLASNMNIHTHETIEVMYVPRGNVSLSVEGQVYPIEPGDIVVVPPNLLHRTLINAPGQLYERYVAHIYPTYIYGKLREQRLNPDDYDYLHHVTVIHSSGTDNSFLRFSFASMHELFSQNSAEVPGKNYLAQFPLADPTGQYKSSCYAMVECLLLGLVIHLGQLAQNRSNLATARSNPTVERAIHYIHDHYSDPELSVSQVAQAVFVSEGHLTRLFKQFTGSSPYSYLTQLRLTVACDLLEDGVNVLDTSIRCGFHDYTAFLRAFKSAYSVTPHRYRQNRPLPGPEY